MELVAIGFATACVYALWVAWAPLLPSNVYVPLLDLGKITGYTWSSAAFYLGLVGTLYVLYALGYRLVASGRARLRLILGLAGVFCAELLLVYPATAADVFSYVAHARLLALHHVNPFVVPPSQFGGDAIVPYLAYPDEPSQYGPIWVLLGGLLTGGAGAQLVPEILLYKGLAAAAHLGGAALVFLIARRLGADARQARASSYLFAWNPLLVWEMVGNAHNDGLMMLGGLAAAWALAAGADLFVLPALVVGALVKLPIGVTLPVLGLAVWRRRPAAAIEGGLLGAALAFILYRPFWDGPATLTALRRTDLFTASFGSIVRLGLEPGLGVSTATQVARWTSLGGFALVLVVGVWYARCASHPASALTGMYVTLLGAVLLATTWFQAWYVVWPCAIGAALAHPRRHLEVALLSLGGLLQYFVFIYLWVIGMFPPMESLPLQLTAYAAIIGPLAVGLAWSRLEVRPFRPNFVQQTEP